MPTTTIEQDRQGRTRQRRPSITQQLQRLLHIDKQSDQRQNDAYEASSNTSTNPIRQLRHASGNLERSTESMAHESSDITSITHSLPSQLSLSSRPVDRTNSESKYSSVRSLSQDSQQSPQVTSLADAPEKHGIRVSSTMNNNGVERKDRRATKRLEAERVDLEKRLLKLEQAERTGDIAVLKRESRRLTKKQPLGSSSRSSSASRDESRPSSRLSSIFSSARRRSRSRSSSVDRSDPFHHVKPDELPASSTTNTPSSNLSITLPDRLSEAISKELLVKNNALLPYSEQSVQSIRAVQPDPTATESLSQQSPHSSNAMKPSSQPEPIINSEVEKENRSQPNLTTTQDSTAHQTDLDKASFAATLNSGKRTLRASNSVSLKKGIGLADSDRQKTPTSIPKAQQFNHSANISKPFTSSPVAQSGLSRGSLNRSFTDGIPQKHHRRFKSSPLAESAVVNNTTDLPSDARATTLSNNLAKPSQNLGSSVLNRGKSNASKGSPLTRASTFNSSQTIQPSRLAKPRFYSTSLGNSSSSSGGPEAKGNAATETQTRLERNSMSSSQKNTKSSYHDLSHSSKPEIPQKSPARPLSHLSTMSLSQDSGSDGYNTADESASNPSKSSDQLDANQINAFPILSESQAEGKVLGVPNKCLPSSVQDDSSSTVSTIVPTEKITLDITLEKVKRLEREKIVAKLFVICCHCKFWHDMPSEVYAKLHSSTTSSAAPDHEFSRAETRLSGSDQINVSLRAGPSAMPKSSVSSSKGESIIKCCWCQHHMSKQCCQGWTTVVHMHQRHH